MNKESLKNRLFFNKNAQDFTFNLLFFSILHKKSCKMLIFWVDKRQLLWYNYRTASAGSGPFGRTNSHMANFASCLTFEFRSARIPKLQSYGLDSCLFWFLPSIGRTGPPPYALIPCLFYFSTQAKSATKNLADLLIPFIFPQNLCGK